MMNSQPKCVLFLFDPLKQNNFLTRAVKRIDVFVLEMNGVVPSNSTFPSQFKRDVIV